MENLRLPNITADTPEKRMTQMQSYMYQLVEQLNYVLSNVNAAENGDSSGVVVQKEEIVINNGSSATPEETFSEIKSLIIKSSEIVEAYYEVIMNEFNSTYFADSDFGTFVENANQSIEYSSKGVSQLFEDIQQIQTDVMALGDELIESNAWMNSGLLDYDEDGVPIYGLEVGQRTLENGEEVFDKFARFTADGVYFYLPSLSDPIAYMSGNKLYITNAQITGNLTLGRYVLDTSAGLAFIWIGG